MLEVITVLTGVVGWKKCINQTRENCPQKLAIVSPIKMHKVEMQWTVVAVLAGQHWRDKLHQLTHEYLT